MSSKNIHRLHGFALASGLAFWGFGHQDPSPYLICAVGAMAGFSAPDWMEISWHVFGRRHCLIPHRTITHVVSIWVVVLLIGFYRLNSWEHASPFMIGFSLSALIHLAFDYSTPLGVPLWPWAPSKRIGLKR